MIQSSRIRQQQGFSLVELIIVVVIIGVLAAVAVPILNGIQDFARDRALMAIAAEAATGAAAQLSKEEDPEVSLTVDPGYSVEWAEGKPTKVDEVCVRVIRLDTNEAALSGPGCGN